MAENLLHRSRRATAEGLMDAEESKRGLGQLPFDLTAELGSVIEAEEISPGVYSILTDQKEWGPEYYVVMKDAPAISDQARSYGQQFAEKDAICVYRQDIPGSGRRVIEFEVLRYQIKHHLPVDESKDSIYTAALYGMEENPDYFGEYPVPGITPRGCTVRHRKIINGVYWLETDRCEEMLSVCYPIWQSDLTIPEQRYGEQLEYDQIRQIDSTLGNLFFSKDNSYIPLFGLSLANPEIRTNGVINTAALFNAICASYPEYTSAHNKDMEKYERGILIKETPDVGTEFIKF